MRTIVVGDIHGGLKALKQLLNRINIATEDKLIFLGDYVDGWSEAAQVIDYLIELSQTNNCIFIKGNHDVWCEQWLRHGSQPLAWVIHGGKETMDSYDGFSKEEKKKHLHFFEDMPLFYIDKENRLFLHAGFTSENGVLHELPKSNLLSDRTLWNSVLEAKSLVNSAQSDGLKRSNLYKEVYIGHTPTTRYNSDVPMNALNVWNIDTGAAFKGKLSAVDINTKEVFQSEPVYLFYPDELGRNK